MFDFKSRIKKVQKLAERKGVDHLIIASGVRPNPNVVYLTGEATTPSIVWITPDETRFYGSVKHECFDECCEAKEYRKQVAKLAGKKVAVDERANGYLAFSLSKKNKVTPVWKDLARMRELKDEHEIAAIRRAQEITKQVVFSVEPWGKSEMLLTGELELAARRNGCALDAFPPIVISNENSSIPHGVPTTRVVSRGDVLLFDVGVTFKNYCADFSHTVYEGSGKVIWDAVNAVKESQTAAINMCRPGVKGKDISKKALEVLKEYGFEKNSFKRQGLSLGHLVGLDVHDGVTPFDKLVLRKGMAFTIEPGVYFPGKWGVRFEDIVTL